MNNVPCKSELNQFTGTMEWHKYMGVLLTDGVKYVADRCGAWWLIDIIVSCQCTKIVKNEEFQVWKLKVFEGNKAKVVMEDGNNNKVYEQKIEYTDFPWQEFTMLYTNNVMLLPSEY